MHKRPREGAGRLSPLPLAGLLGGLLSLQAPLPLHAGELPPPPRSMIDMPQMQLYLEPVINGRPSARVIPVDLDGQRLSADAADLRSAGLPLDAAFTGPVFFDQYPAIDARYDSTAQRLLLNVPASWFPEQRLDRSSLFPQATAHSSFGLLLNYDLYNIDTDQAGSYSSAWTEVRLFGPAGVLSNSGIYQHTYSGDAPVGNRYLRYDTLWRYSDERRMLTYEAGDFISNALAWTTPVRMAGVQFSRDFTTRPDIITYPLPQFTGEAGVPTAVDLFIDGFKADSAQLNPGPFTLTNVPFINGRGEAVVVTTDALGRQVSTTLPFYVDSTLLRQGLSDFSIGAGAVRRHYGQKNFAYGPGAATGLWRYGVSDWLTAEARFETASDLRLGGVGGVVKLASFGVLNTSLSQSGHEGDSGQQQVIGYQFMGRHFNLNLQRSVRDREYRDLSALPDEYSLSRQTDQFNAFVSLGAMGNVGVGYFDITQHDRTRNRLLNLSWNRPLWGGSSIYLSGNREMSDSSWSVVAQLVIPLGGNSTFSISSEHAADGGNTQRVNWNRSLPTAGGFGWDVGYATRDHAADYQQASLSWRNTRLQMQGGIYGSHDDYNRWLSAQGSLVWMNNEFFVSNEIRDAFVVVSTDGVAGIPVRYENQLIGKTGAKGNLLVPWASAYYNAKYEIDTLALPSNMETPDVEKRVAVKAASGYLLAFEVTPVIAASIILHDDNGQPLPVGSRVRNGERQARVGWDGMVYLEGLAAHNQLSVERADGQGRCQSQFEMDTSLDHIAQIGPLVCR